MSIYTVQTLNQDALMDAAGELLRLALWDGSVDLVVGVRTGGMVVAEAAMKPAPKQIKLLPITCRRKSTATKESSRLLKTWLPRLPYWITNHLRIFEHERLMAKAQMEAAKTVTEFDASDEERAALETYIKEHAPEGILVMDDSVDSGATLKAVVNYIKGLAGDIPVRSAAITVTSTTPLIQPDYALHKLTLCRFPWSYDFRG